MPYRVMHKRVDLEQARALLVQSCSQESFPTVERLLGEIEDLRAHNASLCLAIEALDPDYFRQERWHT